MYNFQTERKAIHNVAAIFTSFNWIFREQPLVDVGIDALVEITKNGSADGKFIALQIKGGDKNFHRSKGFLTFYFSERHHLYWSSVSKSFPLLIVLEDPVTNNIYWEHFSIEKVSRTEKHWKIDVPTNNVLDTKAKEQIEKILANTFSLTSDRYFAILSKLEHLEESPFNISYFLSPSKQELHGVITMNGKTATVNFRYKPLKKHWDKISSNLTWDDPYYFTLRSVESFSENEYSRFSSEKKRDFIDYFQSTIEKMVSYGGINKVAETMFNYENSKYNIPPYKKFIEAFEQYSHLSKKDYQIQIVQFVIYFITKECKYIVDTWEGRIAEIKDFVRRKSYDEIYSQTRSDIWSKIYLFEGIEKEEFIPKMYKEWELYWEMFSNEMKEDFGIIESFEDSKNKSWRELETFTNLYNDSTDIINLAYRINDMELFPMAVFAMLKVFDTEACYDQYCTHEFYDYNDWESISINREDWDEPVFFIKRED